MLTWVVLFILFVLLYTYLKKAYKYWENKNVPHLKPWPLVGSMAKFIFRRQCMADCVLDLYNSHDSRYTGVWQFLLPTLMIKDVNLIKQIGIKDFDHFVDHPSFLKEDIDPLFSKNLPSLRGDKWRNMRSTLSPAFTGSKMRAMFVLMSECAEQYNKYFLDVIDPNIPLTLELKDTFTRFANDVIASAAFGITCDSIREKTNEFYLKGKDATNFDGLRTLKFMALNIFPKLMSLLKFQVFTKDTADFFRNVVKNNIKEREENGIVRPDMIHLLMEARKGNLKHEDKHKDEGAGFATVEESQIGKQEIAQQVLTDDDITAQALIFFFAGFESISSVLCHTVYELALNEDIQEKLQKEIDDTLKECKGKITYDIITKMIYLDMVISEGLRKWPSAVATDRICTNDYTIEPENPAEIPVHIKKNDSIWFPIYALHRDPKYFPNPDKFDPERFSEENKENIVPFSYIPFGIGPRNCIGSRFALLEAKTLLFHMLSKFSFVVVEKTQIPIVINKTQFNMNAEGGFWLGLKLRT